MAEKRFNPYEMFYNKVTEEDKDNYLRRMEDTPQAQPALDDKPNRPYRNGVPVGETGYYNWDESKGDTTEGQTPEDLLLNLTGQTGGKSDPGFQNNAVIQEHHNDWQYANNNPYNPSNTNGDFANKWGRLFEDNLAPKLDKVLTGDANPDYDTYSGAIGNQTMSSIYGIMSNMASGAGVFGINADDQAKEWKSLSQIYDLDENKKIKAGLSWDYITNPKGLATDFGQQLGSMIALAPAGVLLSPVTAPVGMLVGGALKLGAGKLGATSIISKLAANKFEGASGDIAKFIMKYDALTKAPESLAEAGGVRADAMDMKLDNADRRGLYAFLENMALLGVSNTIEGKLLTSNLLRVANNTSLWKDGARGITREAILKNGGKLGAEMGLQGGEEYYQQGIQNQQTDKYYSFDPRYGSQDQYDAFKSTLGPTAILGGVGGAMARYNGNRNDRKQFADNFLNNPDYLTDYHGMNMSVGGDNGTGAYRTAQRWTDDALAQEEERRKAYEESHPQKGSLKDRFFNAIGMQESSGNYNAENKDSGAFGKYQIMPENWSSWAEEAGLDADAPQTAENQEIVAKHKLGEYFDKYGAEGAMVAWYAGEGNAERWRNGENTDVWGRSWNAEQENGPSIAQYVNESMQKGGLSGNDNTPSMRTKSNDYSDAPYSSDIIVPKERNYEVSGEVSDPNLAGNTEAKLRVLSERYKEKFGNPLFVTSMSRNGNSDSWHDGGMAFDVADDTLEKNADARDWLVAEGRKLGLAPLDEYDHPSENATGGHIHFSNHDDAALPKGLKYASEEHQTTSVEPQKRTLNESVYKPEDDAKKWEDLVTDDDRTQAYQTVFDRHSDQDALSGMINVNSETGETTFNDTPENRKILDERYPHEVKHELKSLANPRFEELQNERRKKSANPRAFRKATMDNPKYVKGSMNYNTTWDAIHPNIHANANAYDESLNDNPRNVRDSVNPTHYINNGVRSSNELANHHISDEENGRIVDAGGEFTGISPNAKQYAKVAKKLKLAEHSSDTKMYNAKVGSLVNKLNNAVESGRISEADSNAVKGILNNTNINGNNAAPQVAAINSNTVAQQVSDAISQAFDYKRNQTRQPDEIRNTLSDLSNQIASDDTISETDKNRYIQSLQTASIYLDKVGYSVDDYNKLFNRIVDAVRNGAMSKEQGIKNINNLYNKAMDSDMSQQHKMLLEYNKNKAIREINSINDIGHSINSFANRVNDNNINDRVLNKDINDVLNDGQKTGDSSVPMTKVESQEPASETPNVKAETEENKAERKPEEPAKTSNVDESGFSNVFSKTDKHLRKKKKDEERNEDDVVKNESNNKENKKKTEEPKPSEEKEKNKHENTDVNKAVNEFVATLPKSQRQKALVVLDSKAEIEGFSEDEIDETKAEYIYRLFNDGASRFGVHIPNGNFSKPEYRVYLGKSDTIYDVITKTEHDFYQFLNRKSGKQGKKSETTEKKQETNSRPIVAPAGDIPFFKTSISDNENYKATLKKVNDQIGKYAKTLANFGKFDNERYAKDIRDLITLIDSSGLTTEEANNIKYLLARHAKYKVKNDALADEIMNSTNENGQEQKPETKQESKKEDSNETKAENKPEQSNKPQHKEDTEVKERPKKVESKKQESKQNENKNKEPKDTGKTGFEGGIANLSKNNHLRKKKQVEDTTDEIKVSNLFDESKLDGLIKDVTDELNKPSANPMFNPKIYCKLFEIGGILLQKGINKIGKWTKTMLDTFTKSGVKREKVEPWLASVWKGLESYPKDVEFDADLMSDFSYAIGEYHNQGITKFDDIISELNKEFESEDVEELKPVIKAAYDGIYTFFNEMEGDGNGRQGLSNGQRTDMAEASASVAEEQSGEGKDELEWKPNNSTTQGTESRSGASDSTSQGNGEGRPRSDNGHADGLGGNAPSNGEKVGEEKPSNTVRRTSESDRTEESVSDTRPEARPTDGERNDTRSAQDNVKTPREPLPRVKGEGCETLPDGNFHFTNITELYGGVKKNSSPLTLEEKRTMFNNNKKAIEALKRCKETGEEPSIEDKKAMALFCGWGAFKKEIFSRTYDNPSYDSEWIEEGTWLHDNITEDEWNSFWRNTDTTYFTPPIVMKKMWELAQKLGLKSGKILEPSMGVGRFFATMPEEVENNSVLTGIEIDQLSGEMSQMLYPDAHIFIQGFEKNASSENSYDFVIGNVPFANVAPYDSKYSNIFNDKPLIHDLCIIKSIALTKPNGIVMLITASGTMDKVESRYRTWMAQNAELVGAIRLPNSTFNKTGATGVSTDILVFKKRETPINQIEALKEDWVESQRIELPDSGAVASVNGYFIKHPEMIAGSGRLVEDKRYGARKGRLNVTADSPIDSIDKVIKEQFPSNIMRKTKSKKENEYTGADLSKRNNTVYFNDNGELVIRDGIEEKKAEDVEPFYTPRRKNTKQETIDKKTKEIKEKVTSLVKLCEQYQKLKDAILNNSKEKTSIRKATLEAYNKHIEKYGEFVTFDKQGRAKFSEDLMYLFSIGDSASAMDLSALTMRDDTFEGNGKRDPSKNYFVGKPADILVKDNIKQRTISENPSISEAYLSQRIDGSTIIDMDKLAKEANVTKEQAIKELIDKEAVYELPDGTYQPSDIYLSGNVVNKLNEAQNAVEQGNERLKRNVEKLKEVRPALVPSTLITTNIGASWIPTTDYEDFFASLMGFDNADALRQNLFFGRKESFQVTRSNGTYKVILESDRNLPASLSREKYGTERRNALDVFVAALNHKKLNVYDKVNDGGRVKFELNIKETEKLNMKIDDMNDHLSNWMWRSNDTERKTRFEFLYNDTMNAFVTPHYNGSFLELQGLIDTLNGKPFAPRKHQRDFLIRSIVDGRGFAAHEAGTGKTLIMAMLCMEMRRIGKASKPIIFAHPANSEAVASDIKRFYPLSKVLYIPNLSSSKNSEEQTKRLIAQIRTGDWDAIVVPHQLIHKFKFNEATLKSIKHDELEDAKNSVYATEEEEIMNGEGGNEYLTDDDFILTDEDIAAIEHPNDKNGKYKNIGKKTRKALQQYKKHLYRIQKQAFDENSQSDVSFEHSGIDMVLVDEAHEFKKAPKYSKRNVKGLDKGTSNSGIEMSNITDYINAIHDNKNVFMFTGTMITNTMPEVHTMMRYVMPDVLKATHNYNLDDFLNNFAETVSDIEPTATGENEEVERLKKFVNVVELKKIAGTVVDIITTDDLQGFEKRKTKSGKILGDKDLTSEEESYLLDGRMEDPKGLPYMVVKQVVIPLTKRTKEAQLILQNVAKAFKNASGLSKGEMVINGTILKLNTLSGHIGASLKYINNSIRDTPNSKVKVCVDTVKQIYDSHPLACQAIFCENGYSDSGNRKVKEVEVSNGGKLKVVDTKVYSVPLYSPVKDIVNRLVESGIPANEIAVVASGFTPEGKTADVHVAKGPEAKTAIADKMNTGEIRVVIGMEKTLGVGVNMQENLRAIHHFDAPWMPGQLEQENKRGKRQGNKWNTCYEYRYVAQGFDGKKWSALATKSAFIDVFMDTKNMTRVLDSDVLGDEADENNQGNNADIVNSLTNAIGDSRFAKLSKLKQKLDKESKRSLYAEEERRNSAKEIETVKKKLVSAEKQSKERHRIGEIYEKHKNEPFKCEIKDAATGEHKTFTKKTDANKYISEHMLNMAKVGKGKGFLKVCGITLDLEHKLNRVNLNCEDVYISSSENIDTIINQISKQEKNAQDWDKSIQKKKDRIKILEGMVNAENPYKANAEILDRKVKELEKDLKDNPVPAPEWFTLKAPLNTFVTYNGERYVVSGYSTAGKKYALLAEDVDGKELRMPAKDVYRDGVKLFTPEELARDLKDEVFDETDNPTQEEINKVKNEVARYFTPDPHYPISLLVEHNGKKLTKAERERNARISSDSDDNTNDYVKSVLEHYHNDDVENTSETEDVTEIAIEEPQVDSNIISKVTDSKLGKDKFVPEWNTFTDGRGATYYNCIGVHNLNESAYKDVKEYAVRLGGTYKTNAKTESDKSKQKYVFQFQTKEALEKFKEHYGIKSETVATVGDDGYVQYSILSADNPEEKKKIDELNKASDEGKTIKVYRAMVMVNGNLYPPMATMEDAHNMQPSSEIDAWEASKADYSKPYYFSTGERKRKIKYDGTKTKKENHKWYAWHKFKEDTEPHWVEVRLDTEGRNAKGEKNHDGEGDLLPALYFDLRKEDGKSVVPARFNPYFHSSAVMLNDQFDTAYKRPNMVVVEFEIPLSEVIPEEGKELHQEYLAKNPVGKTHWNSGVVIDMLSAAVKTARKLAVKSGLTKAEAEAKHPDRARDVYLTRWGRPVRVVPIEEVAKSIKNQLGDYGVGIPVNVITPQVRNALEKLGVKILPPRKSYLKEYNELAEQNGWKKYSVAEVNDAYYDDISEDDVRSSFSWADGVEKVDDDTYSIQMPNGKNLIVNVVDRIVMSEAQAEKARKAHGLTEGTPIYANGYYVKGENGRIVIARKGEKGTLYHEILHLAKEFMTDEQNKALAKAYGREEKQADACRRFRLHPVNNSKNPVARAFKFAWKLYDSIAELFGSDKAKARNVFRDIESGKVFKNGKQRKTGFANELFAEPKFSGETEVSAVRKQYESATDKWMKAPNGKPTNLTEKQWVQTRTPSFLKWFGDFINDPKNASKVVDENGEPLVVYHGTNAEFNVFDTNKIGKFDNGTKMDVSNGEFTPVRDNMFFFTSNKKLAEEHANGAVGLEQNGEPNVMPCFVSTSNALVDDIEDWYARRKHYDTQDWYDKHTAKYQKLVDENGYDGIVLRNPVDNSDVLVGVFKSTQIKSATDNNGAFGPNNPDIRYSVREPKKGKENLQQTLDSIDEEVEKLKAMGIDIDADPKEVADKTNQNIKDASKAFVTDGDNYTTNENGVRTFKRTDNNVISAYDRKFGSPTNIARKHPKIAPYVNRGLKAGEVERREQIFFGENLQKAFDYCGGVEGREQLFNIFLDEDENQKDYTQQEIYKKFKVGAGIVKAHDLIRRLLNRSLKMINKANRGEYQRPDKVVTEKQLQAMKDNKFVHIIGTPQLLSKDQYLVKYSETKHWLTHMPDATKAVIYDMMHGERRNDYQVVRAKDNGDGTYSVDYYECPAEIKGVNGYITHFFGSYVVYVEKETTDEDGNTIRVNKETIDSFATEGEAHKFADNYAKEHSLEKDEHVVVKPLDVLGDRVGEPSPATVGEKELRNIVRGLMDATGMSYVEAKQSINGAVKLTSRHRFLGQKKRRIRTEDGKWINGYENKDLEYVLMRHFMSVSRYYAMETEFKPHFASMFEKQYGKDIESGGLVGDAKWLQKYYHTVNGNPSQLNQDITKAFNTFTLCGVPIGDRLRKKYGDDYINNLVGMEANAEVITCLGLLNMSAAMLNVSQLNNTLPLLNKEGRDTTEVVSVLVKNLAKCVKGFNSLTPEQKGIIRKCGVLYQEGLDNGLANDVNSKKLEQLRRKIRDTKDPLLKMIFKVADTLFGKGSLVFFNKTERTLRMATVLSEFELATKHGANRVQAFELARDINAHSNFIYSKEDNPMILNDLGMAGTLFLQFKKYAFKEMEIMKDMLPIMMGGSQLYSRKQRVTFWVVFILLTCGLFGLPAAEFLDDILKAVGVGSPKDKVQKWAMTTLKDYPWLAKTVMHGAIASTLGINITSRAGMGDVIPTDRWSAAGPMFSKFHQLATANDNWSRARAISPSIYNYGMAITGGDSVNGRGRIINKYDTPEKRVLRAIGFKSEDEQIDADIQRIIYDEIETMGRDKRKAVDEYVANPTAENRQKAKKLGVSDKTLNEAIKLQKMNRRERLSYTQRKHTDFKDLLSF